MLKKNALFRLLTAIALCEGAGILGSFFTVSSIPVWYQTLNQPFFSPPNWIFGPVWIILYALMGISLYLIWEHKIKKKNTQTALNFFWMQLGANAIWSVLFFGLKNPLLGLLDIVLMWVLILITVNKFWKIDQRASILLLPYLAWVSFATILNFSIWQLN